jgi:uncharacterized glyoxalase superfamily protein PhnB
VLHFGGTALFVSDVLTTVDFYERAFGFQRRYIHPNSEYAELATGKTLLAFIGERLIAEYRLIGALEARRNRPDEEPMGAQLTFISENVAEDYQRAVDAGAVTVTSLTALPWGQTVGYVRDLNGALVELCSPSLRPIEELATE